MSRLQGLQLTHKLKAFANQPQPGTLTNQLQIALAFANNAVQVRLS